MKVKSTPEKSTPEKSTGPNVPWKRPGLQVVTAGSAIGCVLCLISGAALALNDHLMAAGGLSLLSVWFGVDTLRAWRWSRNSK